MATKLFKDASNELALKKKKGDRLVSAINMFMNASIAFQNNNYNNLFVGESYTTNKTISNVPVRILGKDHVSKI